eukprot:1078923-Rhodomonas_salina.1
MHTRHSLTHTGHTHHPIPTCWSHIPTQPDALAPERKKRRKSAEKNKNIHKPRIVRRRTAWGAARRKPTPRAPGLPRT